MPDPLVRVDHVFKRFRLGGSVDSLRDLIGGWLSPGRKSRNDDNRFWAVHDVSFTVSPGEAFGIIGPNGAGKSTLLKLLAGIMRPTQGRIGLRGRVSALIELGAGFHEDLTGRENIYLNASVLGMSRQEVRRKFDDIVEFAGIGAFLDMPVKRYSSGMHARLGFAVAAHVEPQVLLVDEVLSVGDRVFRARCMERMKQFLRDGVAVVFVSHDLGAVARFCDRALVIDHGQEVFCGPVSTAVARYYDACARNAVERCPPGVEHAAISDARVLDGRGRPSADCAPGDRLCFEYSVQFAADIPHPSFGLSIIRVDDQLTVLETSSTRLEHVAGPVRPGDRRRVRFEFDANLLPGEYAVGCHVRDRDALAYAAQEFCAQRIMVKGDLGCGGVVHVAPIVEVAADSSGDRRDGRPSFYGAARLRENSRTA